MSVDQISLSVLTSIITGGFVLVFVEIGNRRNREVDRHEQLIAPFVHKLSAYFRYLSWCRNHVEYPQPLNSCEKEIKLLIDDISNYGGGLIISGGDFRIDFFCAEELYQIALKINNIWYWHDKMRPCRLKWNNQEFTANLIAKELKEINPIYLNESPGVDLIAKVSGDFYIDIYQQIREETYKHELFQQQYKRQTIAVASFFCFVLLVLSLMVLGIMVEVFLRISTFIAILMLVVSLMILAVDMRKQIQWWRTISGFIGKYKSHKDG